MVCCLTEHSYTHCKLILCLVQSCKHKPCQLSGLGVWGAHPSTGSLKSWNARGGVQTLRSSGKGWGLGFPPSCKVLCKQWSLWRECASALPVCTYFLLCRQMGRSPQLVSRPLSEGFAPCAAVHPVCPQRERHSGASCVMSLCQLQHDVYSVKSRLLPVKELKISFHNKPLFIYLNFWLHGIKFFFLLFQLSRKLKNIKRIFKYRKRVLPQYPTKYNQKLAFQ